MPTKLREGNVFTGVCLFKGVGTHPQGWICPGGGYSPPPQYMGYYGIRSTSGRYASYWNAFLLSLKFDLKKRQINELTEP